MKPPPAQVGAMSIGAYGPPSDRWDTEFFIHGRRAVLTQLRSMPQMIYLSRRPSSRDWGTVRKSNSPSRKVR
jgi:hypothetical protein